jgi:hypothetical protein
MRKFRTTRLFVLVTGCFLVRPDDQPGISATQPEEYQGDSRVSYNWKESRTGLKAGRVQEILPSEVGEPRPSIFDWEKPAIVHADMDMGKSPCFSWDQDCLWGASQDRNVVITSFMLSSGVWFENQVERMPATEFNVEPRAHFESISQGLQHRMELSPFQNMGQAVQEAKKALTNEWVGLGPTCIFPIYF